MKALEILLVALGLIAGAAGVSNRIAAAIPRRRWRRELELERLELRRIEREILEAEMAPARLTP